MPRDDLILVEDMLNEVRDALEFVRGVNLDAFLADRRTCKAVAYSLQTLGEAASHVSEVFIAGHPDLPWHEMIGMRHRLVHGYRAVSFEIVWAVTKEELPELEILLSDLVEE
jgi:uncharacterized protein with HEPN domain